MPALNIGDIVMRASRPPDPHRVDEVRPNGKVVLRSTRFKFAKAVTVKLANIGNHRNAGTTFYVEREEGQPMPRLTPARRAFLEAATVHPILRVPGGDYKCGGAVVAYRSGGALEAAGMIEPILQGDYTAELWDGDRLVGYRYRLTEAGRVVVATTEE